MTAEKVELGKQLYFDRRLSQDNSVSCADCHDPKRGWSNGEAVATGFGKKKGGRSAPTVLNTAYQQFQFWDGREDSLEHQALGPVQNPIEMNMSLPKMISTLEGLGGYQSQFKKVFGRGVNKDDVAKAIAAFERTVLSGNAPYDRYKAGDTKAMSAAAIRGMDLFFNKGHCSACHTGPNFTDNGFHNVGVGMDKKEPDVGRYAISKQLGDRGAFKTPTLRDIARSAPYMHDGSEKTLEEVIDHYDQGGTKNEQLDAEIYELKLTPAEKADLIVFLKEGLSSSEYPDVKPPVLPK
jgi:cytochrome c peroxidase